MRHLAVEEAAVAAACRRSAKEGDLGPAGRIRVRVDRRRVRVVLVETTAVRVVLVDPATTVARADLGVQVDPATTVARADLGVLADLATSAAPGTTVGQAAPADLATSAAPETTADLAVPATSDRGRAMPSVASMVNRGAMEQRRGVGEHPRAPGGADRSLPRAECGIKGRSTIGASRNNRYGTGTKTVGASGSSGSGFRCNEPAG